MIGSQLSGVLQKGKPQWYFSNSSVMDLTELLASFSSLPVTGVPHTKAHLLSHSVKNELLY